MTIAFVVKGYPRLSETFIAQEIHGLETRGLDIRIVALRRPTDGQRHPIHAEIAATVDYLPEYLHREPVRVARALRRIANTAGFGAAWRAWRADLARDPTPNRIRRFGQAAVLAAELPAGVTRLHAHFLHTPCSVARYAALMTGLPFSASGHAKDIWTTPDRELRGKIAAADWVVVCSKAGFERLAEIADPGDRAKIELVYHGLDLSRFTPPAATTRAALPHGPRPATGMSQAAASDGTDPNQPALLLSVGRAVEKKGFDVLIDALALLPPELSWRWTHIGGGALARQLQRQAARAGLDQRIVWQGPQAQAAVHAAYRAADLFILPSRLGKKGDRDGLPNVLMEAQSQGLACIASDISGVPELIEDGRNGRLTPPGDAPALAKAIAELIANPARRLALGRDGANRINTAFSADIGLDRLAAKFGAAGGAGASACVSHSTHP